MRDCRGAGERCSPDRHRAVPRRRGTRRGRPVGGARLLDQELPRRRMVRMDLSSDGDAVICAKGLVVGAEHSFAGCPPLEVMIHPGGQGPRRLLGDSAHLDWVRLQRQQVPLLASVCTGSLVYAAAGLLAGRPATTHWASLDRLTELDSSIELRPEDRYVDDGDMITSGGISAGIDMALHLIAR